MRSGAGPARPLGPARNSTRYSTPQALLSDLAESEAALLFALAGSFAFKLDALSRRLPAKERGPVCPLSGLLRLLQGREAVEAARPAHGSCGTVAAARASLDRACEGPALTGRGRPARNPMSSIRTATDPPRSTTSRRRPWTNVTTSRSTRWKHLGRYKSRSKKVRPRCR